MIMSFAFCRAGWALSGYRSLFPFVINGSGILDTDITEKITVDNLKKENFGDGDEGDNFHISDVLVNGYEFGVFFSNNNSYFDSTIFREYLTANGYDMDNLTPQFVSSVFSNMPSTEPDKTVVKRWLFSTKHGGITRMNGSDGKVVGVTYSNDGKTDMFFDFINGGQKYCDVMYGGELVDWCAIFVGWSIKQVGKDPADYGYSPGVGEFQRSAAAKNTYHENDGHYTPRPGDFLICRSSDCPRNSHIGVVIAVNGDEFTTIEGNTRGGDGVWCYTSIVSENTRYLSSWSTQGFISTDLGGSSVQTSSGSAGGGSGMQFDFSFSKYKSGGGSSGSGNSGGVIIEDSQLAEVDQNYKGKTYREIAGRDLTSEERYQIEKIVHGEEGMYEEGCYLIAQCIRDAIVYNHAEIMKLHLSSSQGGMGYEGYYTTEEPGDWAKEAVKYVFDDGGIVARHRLMFMYDVSGGFYSDWHETQHFILQYKTTRFFDMW